MSSGNSSWTVVVVKSLRIVRRQIHPVAPAWSVRPILSASRRPRAVLDEEQWLAERAMASTPPRPSRGSSRCRRQPAPRDAGRGSHGVGDGLLMAYWELMARYHDCNSGSRSLNLPFLPSFP